MSKAFDLRGGLLCDPVGSGKTATMLGLILQDSASTHWACEVNDVVSDFFSASWLTINATLVICPDHVHEQWIREVDKAFQEGAMEVMSIRNVRELRAAAPYLKDLTELKLKHHLPILVVVALSVIQEAEYEELISPSNQDLKAWLQGTEEWRRGLALDCFVWRRLIIDEVHEVVHNCTHECSKSCPRAALVRHLRSLKSERRWGLTGTAQEVLRDPKSVQTLAQIFRTDFNSDSSSRRFIEHYCRTNQVDAPASVQQRSITVEHTGPEMLIYQQHARDFSIAGLDGTGENPMSAEELLAAVPLLKLCSHFNIAELCHHQKLLDEKNKLSILTASDVARSIYDMKLQTMEQAKAAVDCSGIEESALMVAEDDKPPTLELSVSVALLLDDGLWVEPKVIDGEPRIIITHVTASVQDRCPQLHAGDMLTALGGKPMFDISKRLQGLRIQLEQEQTTEEHVETGLTALSDDLQMERRDLQMRQSLRNAFQVEVQRRAGIHGFMLLSWRRSVMRCVPDATFLRKQTLSAKHTQWHSATSSFVFMRRLWETLCTSNQELEKSCPVCLDKFDAARGGVVLRCGHMFCTECNRKMFGTTGSTSQLCCPLCRLPVRSAADVVDLRDFAVGRKSHAANAEGMKLLKSNDGHHGSKFLKVVEVLRSILAKKDERAIVFCQFADLEMQISHALADVGITHARLSAAKDIFEQTAVLDGFQEKKGQSRVLLLSLEQSASGTNLTAANHVLLIHPMAASTAERALAFEQQAIGRCVRLGQKRSVTVWRFITKGTVEDLLDRRFTNQRQCYGGDALVEKLRQRCPEPSGSGREAVMALQQRAGRRAPRPSRGSRGSSTRVSRVSSAA
jgi:superfamily II DNA or RNA helicase